MPDYRRRIHPLQVLARGGKGARWLPEHTTALNELVRLVAQRCQLGLIDVKLPACLHVSTTDEEGAVVLTQGEGERYRVVAILGRGLLATERSRSPVERLLGVAAWGVRRLSRYTMYVPSLSIILPDPAALIAV